MKKKILAILLSLTLVLTITGCGKDKKEEEKKENVKTLTYEDGGYKTTFKDATNGNFELKDGSTGGKFKEVKLVNESKNIEATMYYVEMVDETYETMENSRKEKKGYKTYKWNNYEGYIYEADKYSLNFNIHLAKKEDKEYGVIIFGEVSAIDNKNANVLEDFNSDEVQNLLNSIEFTR